MNYYQLTVHASSESVEAISEAMMELGVKGVEIFDPQDILSQEKSEANWDYADEDFMNNLMKQDVLVRCYFSETEIKTPADLEDKILTIRHKLAEIAEYLPIGSGLIESSLMAEEDWMNAWREYYKPFRLGEHLHVIPSWQEAETEPDDVVLRIDPGMAFGTGTHETTSLCMVALEKYVEKGDTVLDIGCGSGILGITAAKLGAKTVICSDLDPSAVKVARENVNDNGVDSTVEVYQGDLTEVERLKGTTADVVAANIIADVIIILSRSVGTFLKEGGIFITSGIIPEKEQEVAEALRENGFTLLETVRKGSWVLIVSQKN